MTRGGARDGSGRPTKDIVRRAMVNLDAHHAHMLQELEESYAGGSASETLKFCIRMAYRDIAEIRAARAGRQTQSATVGVSPGVSAKRRSRDNG
jgi:hypothetical protein